MKNTGTDIKVEKGIPIPKLREGGMTDVLRKMKSGDSFLVDEKRRNTVYATARAAGIKVTSRASDQPGKIRVWRSA